MAILRQIRRLQFIDFIIKRKSTGNLDTFSKKNGLSKRGLTNILQEMKEMGFPIKYSRQFNSYYYAEDGEMVKCLFIKEGQILTRDETRKIIGGDTSSLCFSKVKIFKVCATA